MFCRTLDLDLRLLRFPVCEGWFLSSFTTASPSCLRYTQLECGSVWVLLHGPLTTNANPQPQQAIPSQESVYVQAGCYASVHLTWFSFEAHTWSLSLEEERYILSFFVLNADRTGRGPLSTFSGLASLPLVFGSSASASTSDQN